MSDLIERQVAINEIEKLKSKLDTKWLQDICMRNGLIYAQRCVNSLPAVNRWIPCNGRLPDSNRSVIVQYNAMYADGIHKKYAVAFFSKFTGKWVEPLTGQHLDVDMWCEIPLENKSQEVDESD